MRGWHWVAAKIWGDGLTGRIARGLLLPCSALYGVGVRLRNLFYTTRWIEARRLGPAVISIGNLTVGGTGKTPTTLWLAQALNSRGFKVAILSRGYRRSRNDPQWLTPLKGQRIVFSAEDNPLAVGDEALMMSALYGQWVGVGADRYQVAHQWQGKPPDVFLLDDGFQHRCLYRDLDMVLLGADYDGGVIPSGPFREPLRSLRRADLLLVTAARQQWARILPRTVTSPKVFHGSLQPASLLLREERGWEELPLTALSGSKVVAVCGVAKAEPFYRMIRDWEGQIVDTMEFPDHHRYTAEDWHGISRKARAAERVVTTEKDWVKLQRFPFARGMLCALRVRMEVEEADELLRVVERVIPRKGVAA